MSTSYWTELTHNDSHDPFGISDDEVIVFYKGDVPYTIKEDSD